MKFESLDFYREYTLRNSELSYEFTHFLGSPFPLMMRPSISLCAMR